MPKYWVKNYFAHGSFPEVGQKQKTEEERLNDGNNNGQAMHGAHKPSGPTNFHAREIPRSGSKAENGEKRRGGLNDGDNNGQATHGAHKPPGPIFAA